MFVLQFAVYIDEESVNSADCYIAYFTSANINHASEWRGTVRREGG